MKMVNKKGQKYYIIVSMILGLMVLSLSLYFIFNEYFTEDDLDWQVCRQSVLLRANAVETSNTNGVGEVGAVATDLPEKFPFKCKSDLIEIDYYDEERAKKEIADSVASCYALYGAGVNHLYTSDFFDAGKKCFVCSRIHFEEDVVEEYSKKELNVGNYLISSKSSTGISYFDYIYWNSQKESSSIKGIEKDEIINEMLKVSSFNASNGDIIVLHAVREAVGTTTLWDIIFGGSSGEYVRGINFFQPKVNDLLENCETIETIPA